MRSILVFTLILVSSSLQNYDYSYRYKNKYQSLGYDVDLSCPHGKEDTMLIDWRRKGSDKIIGRHNDLIIKNITKSQYGSYICTMLNKTNERYITSFEFELDAIPDVLVTGVDSNNVLTINETQNVEIECKVRSDFRSYWSYKNEYVFRDRFKLYIKYITEEKNFGPYSCVYRHPLSTQTFVKPIYIITKIPKVSVEILPSERLVMSGLIHRKCIGFNLTKSTERFRYLWVDSIGRVVSRNAILEIPIIDESVLGHYICKYRAYHTQKDYESIIEVKLMKEELPSDFEISITSHPSTFLLKQSISMKCRVSGNYKSIHYTWYNYGKMVAQDQILHLKNVQKADQGVYTCFAKVLRMNGDRILLEKEVNQSIKAFNEEKVELLEGETTQVGLNLGITKELHCYVDPISGKKGKDVKWYFEGKQLTNGEMRNLLISRHDSFSDSVLLIDQLELSHEGIFMCRLGEIEKRVDIVVIEELKWLTIHPKFLRIEEGEAVELKCKLKQSVGVTNRDIEWYFTPKDGRKTVDLNIKRWKRRDSNIVDKTRYISLIKAKYTDSGFYICRTSLGLSDTGELVVTPHHKKVINLRMIPRSYVASIDNKFTVDCGTTHLVDTPFGEPEFLVNDRKNFDSNHWKIKMIGPSKRSLTAIYGLRLEEDLTKITCRLNHEKKSLIVKVHDYCHHGDDIIYCPNNQCKPLGRWCTNIEDCFDTLDRYANICYKCDPTQMPCGHKNSTEKIQEHIYVYKKCDATNDCSNRFDELNCLQNKNCDTMHFQCKNDGKIPYTRVCDGHPDCNEGDDEESCSSKHIIKINGDKHYAKIGHDVTLKCIVIGHPIPSVIWRYNWSCLPDLQRMIVKNHVNNCNEIESTLTIKNFQPDDVAIYHCEGIAERISAFSKPFFVVIDG